MNVEEIKDAMEFHDCRTARGRRAMDGREINIEPDRSVVSSDAGRRAGQYLNSVDDLKRCVEKNHTGMSERELECVEFVLEQLEDLARIAYDVKVKNYSREPSNSFCVTPTASATTIF